MKNSADIGSATMIHVPSVIIIGLGIHKLIEGMHRHIRQHGDLTRLLSLFIIRDVCC
jgi:hypothetical protein